MNKKEIHDTLMNQEGMKRAIAIDPSNIEEVDYDGGRGDLFQCINVAKLAGEYHVEFRIGQLTQHRKPRIVVMLFPKCHIAVEIDSGHPISKSLPRMLRRLGVRECGFEVESNTCPPSAEQPAASSFEDIPY